MTRTTKVDWQEVQKEYITDSTASYAHLAEQYGVARKTLQERATREQWPKLRQDLADKAYARFTEKLIDDKSQAQSRHLTQYKNLQVLAGKALSSMNEGDIVVADLEKIARTLKLAIDGERVVLGMPTTVSALSDTQGGDVWVGLAGLIAGADKVLEEHGESN